MSMGKRPCKLFFQSVKRKYVRESVDKVQDQQVNVATEFWNVAKVFQKELSNIVGLKPVKDCGWAKNLNELLQWVVDRISDENKEVLGCPFTVDELNCALSS